MKGSQAGSMKYPSETHSLSKKVTAVNIVLSLFFFGAKRTTETTITAQPPASLKQQQQQTAAAALFRVVFS